MVKKSLIFFILFSIFIVQTGLANECDNAFEMEQWDLVVIECTPQAEQGDSDAQLKLAIAYLQDNNTEQGLKWIQQSIDAGNELAELFLGRCYASGWGFEQDISKAIDIFIRLHKNGNEEALEQLEELSDHEADAQFAIATLYETGDGVNQDDSLAIQWYLKALNNGNTQALNAIKKMAQNEIPIAQYQLAEMYQKGIGVQRDIPKALLWSRKSSENGYENAKELYADLAFEDFIYDADIRELALLTEKIDQHCDDIKCVFDYVWEYIDRSEDGQISLAELSRFQRNLIKWAYVDNTEDDIDTGEIAAINLSAILLLPITTSAMIHSFDYNNDGVLSRDEVMTESEFARLVGIKKDRIPKSVDFKKMGEDAKELLKIIPFPLN